MTLSSGTVTASIGDAGQPESPTQVQLQLNAPARVIVKFDLVPAEAPHDAPAVTGSEISNLCFRHSSQDS